MSVVTAGDIAYTPRDMETMRQMGAWWAYASKCAQQPANAPGCDLFWNAVVILAAVVVLLAASYIVRAMVRSIFATRAENARAAERARVADADTMARYKADIDTQHAHAAEDQLEERIRQALKARKPDEWGRQGVSRDSQARE